MWAVLKIDKKSVELLKRDLFLKLVSDVKFYMSKLKLKKFLKRKIFIKESLLLGDYLLCFHRDFSKKSTLTVLQYCKGLKYFLTDFLIHQNEIINFINKCKKNEDVNGFIKSTFFEFNNDQNFEFISGPFTSMVFRILQENKLSIRASIDKYNVTVSKEANLYRPV